MCENACVQLRDPAMTERLVQAVTLPSPFDIREKLLLTPMTFSAGDMKYDWLTCVCVCAHVRTHVHLCSLPVPETNRHHYSLYVHNCRLVFLLRRDFTQVDAFRPAEFHWKLEQVRGECVCARECLCSLSSHIDLG